MRTREFHSSKSYGNNLGKAKTSQVCVHCGRDVVDPPGYIHLIEGGRLLIHPSSEDEFLEKIKTDEDLESGDLGLHPVGSTCARIYQDWLFVFEGVGIY